MEPAVPDGAAGLFLVVPVFEQHVAAADQDLPRRPVRQRIAVLAGDRHLAVQPAFPGRARLQPAIPRLLVDRDRRGLGQAIGLAHRDAARMDRLDQVRRHDGGAGGQQAQAGEVRLRPAREVDHRLDGRRHQHELGRAVVLKRAQRRRGVEAAVQDHRPPDIEGRRGQDVEPADMEHRQHRQHPVGIAEPGIVDAVMRVDLDRLLGEHGALGMARGARGVDQQAGRLARHPRVAVIAARRLRVPGDPVRGEHDRRAIGGRFAREVEVIGVRHQQSRRRIGQECRRAPAPPGAS